MDAHADPTAPVVLTIKPFPIEEWLRLDRRPAPTFHARPAWALAFADADAAYEPSPLACAFEDGSTCVVPLVRVRGALGWQVFRGTPLGGYTVALSADTGELVDHAHATAAFKTVMRVGHSVSLAPWPLAGDWSHEELGGSPVPQELAVIDLSEGAEGALKRMDGKSRRMAGQAQRRGVTCERASGQAAIDRYYAMLQESAVRWGRKRPTFTKRLLEAVVARGGGDIEIWFANYEGEAIAGGVMLYGGDEASFWSAAMRAEFGTLRPSNALNVAMIAGAAKRGVRWYNLGSSDGLPGVARFKEGLGATTITYNSWKREQRAYTLFKALRGRRRRPR